MTKTIQTSISIYQLLGQALWLSTVSCGVHALMDGASPSTSPQRLARVPHVPISGFSLQRALSATLHSVSDFPLHCCIDS